MFSSPSPAPGVFFFPFITIRGINPTHLYPPPPLSTTYDVDIALLLSLYLSLFHFTRPISPHPPLSSAIHLDP